MPASTERTDRLPDRDGGEELGLHVARAVMLPKPTIGSAPPPPG